MSDAQPAEEAATKRAPKIVEYDVSGALEFIMDRGNNRAARAIKYYEFFVAAHHSLGFPSATIVGKRKRQVGDPEGRFTIKVRSKSLSHARLFAAMKILQEMSKTDRKSGPTVRDLVISLAKPDFMNAYTLFLKEDGWRRARYLASTREFQDSLTGKRKEMQLVADLLEISLAVDPSRMRARQKGGISFAMDVLTTKPDIVRMTVPWMKGLTNRISKTTLDRVWSRFHPVSIIIYLWFGAGLKRPLKLTGKNFTERLFRAVDSDDYLRELVAKHVAVRDMLMYRHYSQIPALCPSASPYEDRSPVNPGKLPDAFYELFGAGAGHRTKVKS